MRRIPFLPFLTAALAFTASNAAAQRADTLRLSLDDAVSRALRTSDEVRLAQLSVDLADASIETARATGLPQFRLAGSYSHVIESARGTAVSAILNQPNTWNFNGNLSQTLFQGGRVFAGMRAARDLRTAAQLTAEETRAAISVAVQRAYLQALFSDRMLGIQSQNAELSSARLEQVKQLASAGRAARYDVLRASVERANLEPAVIQARSDREIALLDLKRILNIPTEQPVSLTTSLEPASVRAFVASFARDTFDTESRASVRSARLTESARTEGVRVARADLLPTVSVFYQWGYQGFPTGGVPPLRGQLGTEFCPAGSAAGRVCNNGGFFRDRNYGVQMSWNIFDGLRTKGNIEQAQALLNVARLQLAQQREQVNLEVARARADFNRTRATFEARAQTSGQAGEAFQLASLRFSRGLGTQLEVSDAQVQLLTAQTNEARSVFDLYLAYAELARAEGRPVPLPPAASRTPRMTLNSESRGSLSTSGTP